MLAPDDLLKTGQVAQALGVSMSTIKRWVDSGALRAARTVGRHRLVEASEALRFARTMNLPMAELEVLVGAGSARIETIDDRVRDALTVALCGGRAREARSLIVAGHSTGRDVAVLADDLIRPVMERVGHRWEVGVLDVFQEHRASRIVESALMDLIRRATGEQGQDEKGPLALGATPEGDLYTLMGLLCELALREDGWEVMNLGPNLPIDSLSHAVRQHQPRLAWLSINHVADPIRFLQQYSSFFQTASMTGTAVILGGRGLGPDLRDRLVGTNFGDRMAHLCEFARRLHPADAMARGTTDRPESAQP